MTLWAYPYVRWHIIFVFIPSIILWLLNWKYLLRYKKTIITITVLSIFWGFIFDIVASSVLKIWYYDHNLKIVIAGLPLEEYLFLIFVPQEITAILMLVRKRFFRHAV